MRVRRLRRGRQDDARRPRSRSGWPREGAKVAVVTIDPAQRLANALGLEELEQRAAPGRAGSAVAGGRRAQRRAVGDDARPEADVRRADRPGRARSRARARRSSATASTASSRARSRDRRSSPRSRSCTTSTARATSTCSCSTRRRRATRSTSSTRRGRLTAFLEGRALKAFLRPTGVGMRVLGRGAAPLLAALRRVTGVDLLTDLSTFFGLLGDMTEDFSARAVAGRADAAAPTRPRSCSSPPPRARADRRGDLVPAHARGRRAAVRAA